MKNKKRFIDSPLYVTAKSITASLGDLNGSPGFNPLGSLPITGLLLQ